MTNPKRKQTKNRWKTMRAALSTLTLIFLFLVFSCEKENLKWNLTKAPIVANVSVTSNSLTSFTVKSNCISDGYDENTTSGFCWAYHQNPTLDDRVFKTDLKGEGNFQAEIFRESNSIIFLRSFSKNKVGVNYSATIAIPWTGNSSNLPLVQTTSISNLSFTSFSVNALLISDGGVNITNKGVCVSTSPNPDLSNSIQIQNDNNSNNSYTLNFSNLSDNSIYYVVAYATNIAGTSYGNVITVNTPKIYSIGETGPAGGTIIYQNPFSDQGWNYLEAAPLDVNGQYPWTLGFTQTGVTDFMIGAGYNNTNSIVFQSGPGSNYAASVALNWIYGSYSDWYLPSMNELKLIKEILFDQGQGGLTNSGTYWSSSEDANYPQNAWTVKMSSGDNQIYTQAKNNNFRVRAIRRF